MNCWWKLEDDESIAVYTEDLKIAKKSDLKVMATYMKAKDGTVLAYQFRLERNSKDYKKIFKDLGLKKKDEYIVKRQKTEVKSEENIVKKKRKKKGE